MDESTETKLMTMLERGGEIPAMASSGEQSMSRRVAKSAAHWSSLHYFAQQRHHVDPTAKQLTRYVKQRVRMQLGWFTVLIWGIKIASWVKMFLDYFKQDELTFDQPGPED